MDYNRAAMKQEVKQAMKQTRPSPMLVTLLFLVVVGFGTSLISGLKSTLSSGVMDSLFSGGTSMEDLLNGIVNYGPDYLEYYMETLMYSAPQILFQMILLSSLISLVSGILTTIWSGLMDAGYAGYCLDMARGANPDLGRIFGGFSRAGSVILAYILVTIFTALWTMLFTTVYGLVIGILIALTVFFDSLALLFVLLMLAATVGYFIGILWAVLRYAMVPYAVIDPQSNLSAMDAIRVSKALMKGRKGRYFVLQLSFFGWYLLESLIVLVGFIIVIIVDTVIFSSYVDSITNILNSSGAGISDELVQLGTQILASILPINLLVALVCSVVFLILDLWLRPYRNGCNARFYVYATGGQPALSSGGQPPYDGGQPVQPYGGQPVQPYGGQPAQPYGGQPVQPYGGQQGSPYGGYNQMEQPSQQGAGAYPQWGVPQAPVYSAAEPFAAPAAPVPPQIPQEPAAPVIPQAPQAPVYSAPEPFAAPAAPVPPQIPQEPVAPVIPQAPQAPVYSAPEPFTAPAAPVPPQFSQEPAAPVPPQVPQEPAAPVIPQAPQAPVYSAAEMPVSPEPAVDPISPEAVGVDPELPLDATVVFTSPNKKLREPKDDRQEMQDGPNYPQY